MLPPPLLACPNLLLIGKMPVEGNPATSFSLGSSSSPLRLSAMANGERLDVGVSCICMSDKWDGIIGGWVAGRALLSE